MKLLYLCLLPMLFSVQLHAQTEKEFAKTHTKTRKAFNRQEYDKVIVYMNRLIEQNPSDYYSLNIKAKALFLSGKRQEAIRAISEALTANPKYVEAYINRGHMLCSENLALGIQDFTMALKHDPSNTEAIRARLAAYFKSAEYEKALADCNVILTAIPTDYEALVAKGASYRKLGMLDSATVYINKAIKSNPKYSWGYDERAHLLMKQNEFEGAITDFSQVISMLSKNKENKENTFMYSHDSGKLIAYSYNNRGFAWLKFGDTQKALADINQSIQMLPSNSYAFRNRAMVYLHLKETENACADLRKALALGFADLYGNEVNDLLSEHCK